MKKVEELLRIIGKCGEFLEFNGDQGGISQVLCLIYYGLSLRKASFFNKDLILENLSL